MHKWDLKGELTELTIQTNSGAEDWRMQEHETQSQHQAAQVVATDFSLTCVGEVVLKRQADEEILTILHIQWREGSQQVE